jgi:uncharacterized protein (DUF1499 family)
VFAILLTLLILAALGTIGTRIFMGREAEDRVEGGEVVDFAHLKPATKPNRFVMCPKGYCPAADAESPVFDVPWERLRDYWSETVGQQPRVKLVAGDGDRRRITYVQHSAVLKFPDIITIEFVPLEGGRSSFAIESRSRYGHSDFGVNKARVRNWVDLLAQMVRR